MKRIRTTISVLAFAIATSSLTDAIAASSCTPQKGGTEYSPFVIGYVTSGDGTVLNPVIYPVIDGKILGQPLTEKDLRKGALAVNGQRCGSIAIAVNRFWNHDLFYTIEIMPGVYIRIDIPHPHPH